MEKLPLFNASATAVTASGNRSMMMARPRDDEEDMYEERPTAEVPLPATASTTVLPMTTTTTATPASVLTPATASFSAAEPVSEMATVAVASAEESATLSQPIVEQVSVKEQAAKEDLYLGAMEEDEDGVSQDRVVLHVPESRGTRTISWWRATDARSGITTRVWASRRRSWSPLRSSCACGAWKRTSDRRRGARFWEAEQATKQAAKKLRKAARRREQQSLAKKDRAALQALQKLHVHTACPGQLQVLQR